MAKNEVSTTKKVSIITFTIIGLVCLVIVGWWTWVQLYAPNKVIYNTHNVGVLTDFKGENQKTFIEAKYYSNYNQNGLKMLDIKFNEYSDETRKTFYSQGLQFVADTSTDDLNWNFEWIEMSRPQPFKNNVWWGSYQSLKNGTVHMYASADDYQTTLSDSQALDYNSDFKIELQNEDGTSDLYLMEFKGTNTKVSEAYKVASADSQVTKLNGYSYSDPYLLSKLIYEQIQSLDNGISKTTVFKFNDMFNFKYYDNGAYVSENERETRKIDVRVNDYYVIKIEVSADGARQASDSLFNNIKGSANFKISDDYDGSDYYFGRSTITCSNDNFDMVIVGENKVALKLKEEFLTTTKPYKDKIELLIKIDVEALENDGYEFVGFTKDSGLENFVIKGVEQ